MSDRVNTFVTSHDLDDECAALLRDQSHALLHEIMADFRKELAITPHLHSDPATFSADVAEMVQAYAEESPLLEVFVDLNGLSADFARLLRLKPRKVQDEVIDNLSALGDDEDGKPNISAGKQVWYRLRKAWNGRHGDHPSLEMKTPARL